LRTIQQGAVSPFADVRGKTWEEIRNGIDFGDEEILGALRQSTLELLREAAKKLDVTKDDHAKLASEITKLLTDEKGVSQDHEDFVASARKTDEKFKGNGRYEAEAWMKLKTKYPDASLPKLSKPGAEYVIDEYESDGKPIPPEVLADYHDLAPPTESLVGGKADNIPDAAFDQAELAKGAAIEQEEHGATPQQAKEIAKDHLVDNQEEYKGEEATAKEPWEMTREEFSKQKGIAFHGTNSGDFGDFDDSKIGSSTDDGLLGAGHYFGTDKEGMSKGRRTMIPGKVEIKNPLLLSMPDFKTNKNELINREIGTSGLSGTTLTKKLKEMGHDGVILEAKDYDTWKS
jgi:hypothetical protein